MQPSRRNKQPSSSALRPSPRPLPPLFCPPSPSPSPPSRTPPTSNLARHLSLVMQSLKSVSQARNVSARATKRVAKKTANVNRTVWLPGLIPPAYLDGSLPGDAGFDPFGLSKKTGEYSLTYRSTKTSGLLFGTCVCVCACVYMCSRRRVSRTQTEQPNHKARHAHAATFSLLFTCASQKPAKGEREGEF